MNIATTRPKFHTISDYDRVPCIQLSKKGELLGRFESINHAGTVLRINPSNICQVLSGRILSTAGYLFIREEYYNPEKKITYNFLKFKRKIKNHENKNW